jgi:predicted methyltransferase
MRIQRIFHLIVVTCFFACGGARSTPGATPTGTAAPNLVKHVDKLDIPPAIASIVAAPDRSDDDKKLDAGRHPAEMLAFFGVAPGVHIAELEAGLGYTTELVARAVVSKGIVYAENNKFVHEKFAATVGRSSGEASDDGRRALRSRARKSVPTRGRRSRRQRSSWTGPRTLISTRSMPSSSRRTRPTRS